VWTYGDVGSRLERQPLLQRVVERGRQRREADDALADQSFSTHPLTAVKAHAHAHPRHVLCTVDNTTTTTSIIINCRMANYELLR